MLRWPALILIALLTACGKPVPAIPDQAPAPAAAVEPTAATHEAAPTATMDEATQIAALINPAKLATLKSRGANPRILKLTAILYVAKTAGKNPEEITRQAVARIGWGGTDKGRLTAAAIIHNLTIAEELGSTTDEDIADMRRGRSPTVRKGPYTGDILSVDHIIPVAAAPELSNTIANLELMPLRLNQAKNDRISDRQRNFAKKLHAAGILADPGKVK